MAHIQSTAHILQAEGGFAPTVADLATSDADDPDQNEQIDGVKALAFFTAGCVLILGVLAMFAG